MKAGEKLVYFNCRLQAENILYFVKNINFYDKDLEKGLETLIENLKHSIYDEC